MRIARLLSKMPIYPLKIKTLGSPWPTSDQGLTAIEIVN
jgi:hypothetical protein